MDGDSRGGAALSVREVSGKPVKFVGTGEKMDALEPFYPERMAQRILGMGDVLTLYEKATEAIREDEAQAFAERLKANKFDFNDFLAQWKKVNSMGGLQVMKLLPGMGAVSEKQLYEAERRMKGFEAMIGSMTADEREAPELLIKSPSRRRRVAEGSGRTEEEVSDMLSQFAAMRVQVQGMGRMMRMSGAGASPEEQQRAMRDMLRQAQAPVAGGMVRRKREKPLSGGGGGDKPDKGPSKGFASRR
jgi:signal recognition particle subunit SRP54